MQAKARVRRGWRMVRILVSGLVALLVVGLLGFVIWALWIPTPMAEALAALESSESVIVEQDGPITFTPAHTTASCGLIFYPGGRVDARAYAPAMHAIAEAGYLAIVPAMPLNFAVLAPGRAAQIMDDHPMVTQWALGGHSLGGAMAMSFVAGRAAESVPATNGLALWAAYGTESSSLANRTELAVTSIYGALDGVLEAEIIESTAHRLPPQTAFVRIEGGNHAQFGWYGAQRGDNPATIARSEQQAQTVAATLDMLDAMCAQ